jgi:hypothetical protein
VNFRLSEDEFEKLRDCCASFGARSISDFARSSVLSRLEQDPQQESQANHRISHLDYKVSELESRVGQLLHLLDATGTTQPVSYSEMPEMAPMAIADASSRS